MKKCPNCSCENDNIAVKCGACGRPLSDIGPDDQTAKTGPAPGPAVPVWLPMGGMLFAGWVLILVGLVAAIGATAMTTSVDVEVPLDLSVLGMSPLSTTRSVANLGKLQAQMLAFVAGCATTVAGIATVVVAIAARELAERMKGYAALLAPDATTPAPAEADAPVSRVKQFQP